MKSWHRLGTNHASWSGRRRHGNSATHVPLFFFFPPFFLAGEDEQEVRVSRVREEEAEAQGYFEVASWGGMSLVRDDPSTRQINAWCA